MPRRRTIILVVALLTSAAAAVLVLVCAYRLFLGGSVRYKPPLVIAVQASYPGANAQTVADTVAAPIEQQVNGVENMLDMTSRSGNDGSYTLHVRFRAGTDLDVAQVLVQNRVSLALPVLPDLVRRQGISVRKSTPEPLVLLSLTSPDNRYDTLYLSNYATVQVASEFATVPGVGDTALFGQRESQMRVALDADKLAALQVTAADVVTALTEQNVQLAGGSAGQQLEVTVNPLGRLTEPEQLESVIVKATKGRTIRLKDVARVELGVNERGSASLNGRPAVLVGVSALRNARPGEVSRAVLDKLADLQANAPEGLALAVAFDFAPNLEGRNTPEHLVIDAELPPGASAERTAQTLQRAAEQVQKTPGVQDVLALTEHPFAADRNRPCLVVRLSAKAQREQTARDVRAALQEQIAEALFRLSVPSPAAGFPVYGFPIEFVIEDRGDHGTAALQESAAALAAKMNQSGKFADVGVGAALRQVPMLSLDINRAKCLAQGVEIKDIFTTIQAHLGPASANTFNQFGRTWQMTMPVDPRFRDGADDIRKLRVKNKQNQLVPLGTVIQVRLTSGPMAVERHNLYPIARITANLAEGVSLAEAKALCDTLAGQEFDSKRLELIWPAR